MPSNTNESIGQGRVTPAACIPLAVIESYQMHSRLMIMSKAPGPMAVAALSGDVPFPRLGGANLLNLCFILWTATIGEVSIGLPGASCFIDESPYISIGTFLTNQFIFTVNNIA